MINKCYLVVFVILQFIFSFESLYAFNKKENKQFDWLSEIELLKRVDLLPVYRTGSVVEQISSYQPSGGNDDGFSGRYSYLTREKDGKLVLADLKGPGVINRIWTPTPTDDTISFYFDGEKLPRLTLRFIDLFSGKVYPFLKPICGNEVGGYYCYLPIPYRQSCKIVFSGKKIQFHQIQFRNLPGYTVESYNSTMVNQAKLHIDSVNSVWNNISPELKNYAQGRSANYKIREKNILLKPGETVPFFILNEPGRIIGLEVDAGTGFEGLYKDVILKAIWDDENVEAIYAPVADFFGYAFGRGTMRSMLIGKKQSVNYCYFPFPFDKKAELSLAYRKREGQKQLPQQITIKIYYTNIPRNITSEGKFYSVWRREINPQIGKHYEFAKLNGKGHYVGTIHQAQGLRPEMTYFFEGDDSISIDGKMRMHGTGSEDYYNGGWYAMLDRWDRGISLPLHGSLDYSLPMSRTGGYRFYMTDKMSFEKNFFIGIEHGPEGNAYPVDYTSVAFYYSDVPPNNQMEISEELRTIYHPQEHQYYPQLMDLSLGEGVSVKHKRGLRIKTENEGFVRIMLNDVPEGNYKVFISYVEKPDGAEFSIWQRQKQLSPWQSSKAAKEILKHNIDLGEIILTPQTNSISVYVRDTIGNLEFELDKIYLKRIK